MSQVLKTRYAIVGAGIAGVAAAEAVREVDSEGRILLINGEAIPPYCRPLIIEVLKGERAFADIHLRPPEWSEAQRISLITGDPAERLHPEKKTLELQSGHTIEWERLLLATGSKPALPPIRGLEDVPGISLYRYEDVERLRQLLTPGARALLVGIGLIGIQAITALKELGVSVTAVEVMHKVLPMILDAEAAKYAQRKLEANGIDVRLQTSIERLMPADPGERACVAVTSGGEEIEFDFLVLAAGMRPDLSLLDGSGIKTDRGINVSPRMETSVSGVFASGDVTEYSNWIEGRPEIHAHWVNAYRQGRVAGLSMAGGNPDPYEPVYLNSLNLFGLPMITVGASRLDKPEHADVYVFETPARPAYKRFVVKEGRLVGVTFINDVDGAGVFQYLVREKVDIGPVARALFEGGLEGVEYLNRLHREAVRGDVDWPESMDRITRYRKDHRHTRWGKARDRDPGTSPSGGGMGTRDVDLEKEHPQKRVRGKRQV